jgi:hypothetical protein
MIPVKNSKRDEYLRVDLETQAFTVCYHCGKSKNPEPSRPFMHDGCWNMTSLDVHGTARRDMTFAVRLKLTSIPKGVSGDII